MRYTGLPYVRFMDKSGSDTRLVEVAKSALRSFSLHGAVLELLKEEVASQGISTRQIYRVRAADGQYVLRVYRPSFSGVGSLMSTVAGAMFTAALARDSQ